MSCPQKPTPAALCLLAPALGLMVSSQPAVAEWGYEASDLGQLESASAPVQPLSKAIDDWLALYSFTAVSKLTEEQRSRIKAYLLSASQSNRESQVMSALKFWGQLTLYLNRHPEEVSNYRELLRTLLRLEARSPRDESAETESASKDRKDSKVIENQRSQPQSLNNQDLVAELLGPLRVAAAGSPPLSEDAVNAYCDMACFLYEKLNPGKTMDALDNRALMVKVICQRYRESPDSHARQAMVNFDLTWVKFKIVWTSADDRSRELLLRQCQQSAAAFHCVNPNDQILSLVLRAGPWGKLLSTTLSEAQATRR